MKKKQNQGQVFMTFGKYKGIDITEVPHGYLMWLYDRNFLKGELKTKTEEIVPILIATKKK